MPYIGRSPEYGGLEKQLITADSSTTTFALTYTVGSESSILVSVAGVLQQPGSAYNLSGGGTNIVFTAAPTTGSDVFVVFLGRAYDSQNIASGAVTGLSALGTSPASADVFLMYDDNASALKKVAYSDLESDTAAMAANTVKVRDANSSGTPSNKAVADTQILIGDGTGFTAAALSGDVTMTNAGVVTIANNSIDSDQYVDGSIDNAHLADDAVGIDELSATGTASSSTFLRGDNAWAAAGGDNTPIFLAGKTGSTTGLAVNTWYKVEFDDEIIDTGGNYDPTTNYRFTPTTAGKYFIGAVFTASSTRNGYRYLGTLYFNGVNVRDCEWSFQAGASGNESSLYTSYIFTFNGSSDYVEAYFRQESDANQSLTGTASKFWGYKLIE